MTDTDQLDTADTKVGLMLVDVAVGWMAVFVVSLISVAIGVMLLVWPGQTLAVLSVLLGLQFIVFGTSRLIHAFDRNAVAPGLFGVLGVLLIGTGVVILRNRLETLAILATIIGIVWIIGGAIDSIDALADREGAHRGLRAVRGLASLAAGVVIVSWPAPTLVVLAWISGLQLVIFGGIGMVTAHAMRRESSPSVA